MYMHAYVFVHVSMYLYVYVCARIHIYACECLSISIFIGAKKLCDNNMPNLSFLLNERNHMYMQKCIKK